MPLFTALTRLTLLADFGLTDGNGMLTLMHRSLKDEEASAVTDDILQADPIEEYSPNISETDPIEFSPIKHVGKTGKHDKPRTTRKKRYRRASSIRERSEGSSFPKKDLSV